MKKYWTSSGLTKLVRPNKIHLNGIIDKSEKKFPNIVDRKLFHKHVRFLKKFSHFLKIDVNKASNMVYS